MILNDRASWKLHPGACHPSDVCVSTVRKRLRSCQLVDLRDALEILKLLRSASYGVNLAYAWY